MVKSKQFERFLDKTLQELRSHSALLPDNPSYEIKVPVDVHIDDVAEATAFARWSSEDNRYEIIFTLGLCIWAFEVATIVAIHADDATAPLPETLDFSDYGDQSRGVLKERIKNAERRLPHSQRGYCEYIFGSILLAVLQHELAHILAGHIDYLKSISRDGAEIDELHILTIKRKRRDAVPPLLFEYEADHVGSQLLTEMAGSEFPALSRWSINTRQENTVLGLFGFTLFTLAVEEATRLRGMKMARYPSPLLRFSTAVTGAKRIWDEDRPGGDFLQTIMIPLGEMLALLEPSYPAIGLLRDFTDPDWQKGLETEIDALLDECIPYANRVAKFNLMKVEDG